MKLRNKTTGEIREARIIGEHLQLWGEAINDWIDYDDLDYLARNWERYKEPKDYWFIDYDGGIIPFSKTKDTATDKLMKQIGNYFETKEEAEKAAEKLKAWKRLKDKGIRFNGWKCTGSISFTFDNYYGDGQPKSASDELDLLFGGEE